ncbi:MAG: aspartate--tRNA ligase [Peptostreptococcales bacterium]
MGESMLGLKRTHYSGWINESDIGKTVTVMGWAQRRRDLGGVIFVDLRDRKGILQIVIDLNDVSKEDFDKAEKIRNEYVIAAEGIVEKRDPETINENIETGTIEVRVKNLRILSEAKTPPFMIEENSAVREEIRLKYRYLDLRRPDMLANIILRHKTIKAARNILEERDFIEVETPIMTKSTPEGARDYLVPSRMNPGTFYALPQSPQIYKQLLMVAGIDKYYQVAKCFRDEDLRADRQPEFTQVDMEMSFMQEAEIIDMLEHFFTRLMKNVLDIDVALPFERLTYQESMDSYGTDKPDLRFGMKIIDLSEIAARCSFKVFRSIMEQGGRVRAINAQGCGDFTRKQIEDLTEKAMKYGAKGMAWIVINEDGSLQSVITKFFKEEEVDEIIKKVQGEPGDFIIFCADQLDIVSTTLGNLRLDMAEMKGLRNKSEFKFVTITEFPLLEWSEEQKRYLAMHHPFTMPIDEDLALLDTNPGKIRAQSYDIVLNGVELGSGSIRIHQKEIQQKVFQLLGFTDTQIQDRFGFMLDAFEYGTPPHGGFAFGVDRLVMLMIGADSIREVMAFPKMKDASCPLTNAPSRVSKAQLEELDLLSGVHVSEESADKIIAISTEDVEYVANLAKLTLSADEKEGLTRDLADIIRFADRLNDLDTKGIEPTAHVMPIQNVFREDILEASFDRDVLLSNAPSKEDGCIFVPKVVE